MLHRLQATYGSHACRACGRVAPISAAPSTSGRLLLQCSRVPRSSTRCRSAYDVDQNVPQAEADKFERIAASLVAKMTNAMDDADEYEENDSGAMFVDFGTVANAKEAAKLQAAVAELKAASPAVKEEKFIPRNKRRKQVRVPNGPPKQSLTAQAELKAVFYGYMACTCV